MAEWGREDSLSIAAEDRKRKKKDKALEEPASISRLRIQKLIGFPEESDHDNFFEALENEMLRLEVPRQWQSSELKNKILNELYTPVPCRTARDALDHLKTLVKQWNRLRQRHPRLNRLDVNLLTDPAYDPSVSFPKFKVLILPFLDVTQSARATMKDPGFLDDDDLPETEEAFD